MELIYILRLVAELNKAVVRDPRPSVTSKHDQPYVPADKRIPSQELERQRPEVVFPEDAEEMLTFVWIFVKRAECSGIVPSFQARI